jgi:AcrR family transcriptional regulator
MSRTKQQVVSKFRRGEILDAARKVFARKGFADGIVDDIAAEAGLAKGTLYLYFRSKKEIYKALLQHDMETLKSITLRRIEDAPTIKDKLRAFILARLENAETHREFFRIMDTQSGGLSFTRNQYRDWLREPVMALTTAIEQAQQSGEARSVPAERVAWAAADLARGAIVRRLVGHPFGDLQNEADFLVELLWASLRP